MGSTYTYDDGSTITIDQNTVSSTPTPAGWAATDYSANITPGAAGAESWQDVLKYGFGRVIDYATVKQTPQNTPAQYANRNGATVYPGGSVMGFSMPQLLLGALVLGGVVIAAKMASKG